MCVNPASISSVSSCGLCAILQMKFSVVCVKRADSRLMHISVDVTVLCPRMCFTCIMSFLSWNSIVPFQWRNVWKVIRWSLGFFSFSDADLRWLHK